VASRTRLHGVDALRFVAACLVVLTHTTIAWTSLPQWTRPISWIAADGGTGVTLFLVLSGFSIHLRWAQRSDRSGEFPVAAFWKRRFLRLYPPYWIAVVVCVVLTVAAEGLHEAAHHTRPWVWLPGQVPAPVMALCFLLVVPANVVFLTHFGRAWSLALEEQLYALYSAGQRLRPRWMHPRRLLLLAGTLSLGWPLLLMLAKRAWVPFADGGTTREELLFFQVPALAFPWVLGFALAEARAGRIKMQRVLMSPAAGAVVLAATVVLRHTTNLVLHLPAGRDVVPADVLYNSAFAWGYAAIVAGFVLEGGVARQRVAGSRVVEWLALGGLWSYSLYLLHPAVLELVDRRSHLGGAPRVLVGWAAALIGSWVFFRLVEKRWLLLSQRSGLPVRDQPAMTTATPTTPEASGGVLLKSRVASPVGSARVPVASPSETLLESSSVTL
jgi:peptidoglycan/LPS O-acetylase OafA/YrhL